MSTLSRFHRKDVTVPAGTGWLLADLGEFRGKQELYTRQAPQQLKALREHAIIESAVSSNRMEGVEVDPGRIRAVLALPKPHFRDRDEEEVRGYREALDLIHRNPAGLEMSEETILDLHRMARGDIWDAGKYKEKDSDIIERYPDRRERIRFRTVRARETSAAMTQLLADWHTCIDERWIHPIIAMAAFNLDFLCIHPFRDGNGRASRLLLLLQCYHMGFEAGRYVSIERLIEQNKDRYYETLEQSSHGWHEGKNDPWPYTNSLFFVLKLAYRELMERVGETKAPRGSKSEAVISAISGLPSEFTIGELSNVVPSVGRDLIRRVLVGQRELGKLECRGRGPAATWIKATPPATPPHDE